MKTKITKTELKKIYEVACKDWKSKIEKFTQRNAFGEDIEFSEKEIQEMVSACNSEQLPIVKEVFNIVESFEQINSLEEACKYLGESDDEVKQLRILEKVVGLAKHVVVEQELVIITKALNEKHVLDWDNHNEYKYFLWWYLGKNFRLDCCGYYFADSTVPARLCFKSREIAVYASEKFKDKYEEYMNK
jgi:hypothetical protein